MTRGKLTMLSLLSMVMWLSCGQLMRLVTVGVAISLLKSNLVKFWLVLVTLLQNLVAQNLVGFFTKIWSKSGWKIWLENLGDNLGSKVCSNICSIVTVW
jgi:hypothetical protein